VRQSSTKDSSCEIQSRKIIFMAIVRRAQLDRSRSLYLAAGVVICLIGLYLIFKP